MRKSNISVLGTEYLTYQLSQIGLASRYYVIRCWLFDIPQHFFAILFRYICHASLEAHGQ